MAEQLSHYSITSAEFFKIGESYLFALVLDTDKKYEIIKIRTKKGKKEIKRIVNKNDGSVSERYFRTKELFEIYITTHMVLKKYKFDWENL